MPAVDVIYYTDPLCSWSWAFEPVWRRLRYELGDQLAWRYRMGGMIPDWRHYADPLNDVASPAHDRAATGGSSAHGGHADDLQ